MAQVMSSPTESKAATTFNVSPDQALTWLRQMLLIRRFEERAEMMYQKKKIAGFFHQYSGQEPVAVGSIGALRDEDYVITAYRDHGHALARGMSARSGMAELLGKIDGCSRGKGGSMHFFDAKNRFLGGHAIVASHLPLAAGVAFASKYRNESFVCICYFGDGAMDQGSLHEAFNMASLWKLPVIYVVENNGMSMGTHLHRHSCLTDLTVRGGTAYGMPGIAIDGNDIELMARTTFDAAERARAGEGPTFIEAHTYRFKGHSISDAAKYRTPEELDKFTKADPIARYAKVLRDRGWLADGTLKVEVRDAAGRSVVEFSGSMFEEVKAEVDDSIEFAENSPEPGLETLYEDITVAPFVPQE